MKRVLPALLVASSLAVIPGAVQAPASATPCNQGTFNNIYKGNVFVFDRANGSDSVYNNPGGGTAEYQVTFGHTVTHGVTKRWEVGGSVGGGWGPVKADISGKYGQDYVDSATATKGHSITVPVKDGWTAWLRADFYRRVVYWQAYTWRWNADKGACVKHTVRKAYWGAPSLQYVVVQKKGRVYP